MKSEPPLADNTDVYADDTTHSFVVRIWLDSPPDGSSNFAWRGHITHVQSGKRTYFSDLDRIVEFICQYLGDDHRPPQPRWRLPDWLTRRDR